MTKIAEAHLPPKTSLLAILQLHDIRLPQEQALILHNEQRPAATSIVREQSQLLQPDVMYHTHLFIRKEPSGFMALTQMQADEHSGLSPAAKL